MNRNAGANLNSPRRERVLAVFPKVSFLLFSWFCRDVNFPTVSHYRQLQRYDRSFMP